MFLFISGNETTRHLIANLLWTLAHDPALIARLRSEPELVATAVEESLRHDPPIQFLMRTCTTDAEVEGTGHLPAREGGVRAGLGQPRRDAFRGPPCLSVSTAPILVPTSRSAAGPTSARVASLARLEGRVAIQVLLDEVADAPARSIPATYENVPVFWAHGPRALSVELVPVEGPQSEA